MDVVMIILRVLHIIGGALWAGGVFLVVLSIMPAVRAAGPEGGRLMGALTGAGRLPEVMSIGAVVTIVSGVAAYWIVSGGLNGAWLGSRSGIVLSLGALAGIVAWAVGMFVSAPASKRIGELGKKIQAAGGPPAPADLAEIKRLQQRLADMAMLGALLLVISVAGMAAARYL